jgi:formylglycine-generating enzyme required for sulfatase activity
MFYRVRGIPAGTVLSVSNMVYIPLGTFVMGSPAGERERRDDEMQHTVTLTQGFWMGRHEVSQEEYFGVMGSNPSYWRNGQSALGSGGAVTNDLRHPVELVSWNDATNYCGRLTARERATGRIPANYRYRLPTEAEWEYACRGGTTNAFHYGKALRGAMANLDARFEYDADVGTISTSNYFGRTSVVGSYMPNGFGLYDMHGNVWEWCADRYGTYPFGAVSDPRGPVSGSNRVFRGGSWFNYGNHCRSAFRYWFDPEYRFTDLGLRVVLATSPQ